MVYGFAKQSSGAFHLESSIGNGTTAELWIPQAPEAAERKPSEAQAEEAVGTPPLRPLHILLVDDHPEVRTTTAAMLQELGHTVIEAANGQEALAALNNGGGDCDLLISDYAMPHISGTEFLRQARKICPDVPALIITGYAEAGAVRDRPESVEILLKPFTPSALEKACARICGGGPVTC
jgi:CheY-like chemotaxis protein